MTYMVNDKQQQLLSYISGEPLSGETLAERLSVSRVAVWKMVQSLTGQGFDIRTTTKGYLCGTDYYDMTLIHGYKVFYQHTVESTMNIAMNYTGEDPLIVIAENQSMGIGRCGRLWKSDPGGLYLTVVPVIKIPFQLLYRSVFGMSIAVVESLKSYGVEACVKWPNDVLVNGKKIAGVLVSARGYMDSTDKISIGVGINLNNDIPENGISLSEAAGYTIDRTCFLRRLLTEWEKFSGNLYTDDIDRKWESISSTIGKKVRIEQKEKIIEGYAVKLLPGGVLALEKNGIGYHALYGDCYHL